MIKVLVWGTSALRYLFPMNQIRLLNIDIPKNSALFFIHAQPLLEWRSHESSSLGFVGNGPQFPVS